MSERTEDTPWDLEDVYDNEISPLMGQIIEICKRVDMPMLASFAFENDVGGNGIGLCTTQLGSFQPQQIRDAAMVLRGQNAAPLNITTSHADGSKTLTTII